MCGLQLQFCYCMKQKECTLSPTCHQVHGGLQSLYVMYNSAKTLMNGWDRKYTFSHEAIAWLAVICHLKIEFQNWQSQFRNPHLHQLCLSFSCAKFSKDQLNKARLLVNQNCNISTLHYRMQCINSLPGIQYMNEQNIPEIEWVLKSVSSLYPHYKGIYSWCFLHT